jgi:hypothetical protein
MSRLRRSSGLALLGLLITTVDAQVHQFNGSVVSIDGDPVPNESVEIHKGGTYLTSGRGEFTFPASKDVDVNSEVLFHVTNWIVTKPCELRNGRTYLPSPERTIDIRVLRKKDPRLAKADAAAKQLMGCFIEEAVSRFDLPLNNPKPSGSLHFNNSPEPTLSMWRPQALREVSYSLRSYMTDRNFALTPSPARAQDSSPHSCEDDLLRCRAEEFGLSKDALASAVSIWLASPHEGYDRGLAELYTGQYAAAKETIKASIVASPGDALKRYVPLARAEYECGDTSAAQSALHVALKAHPTDSLLQNNLSIVAKRPNPPTCLRATVE